MKESIFVEANYISFFAHISNPKNKERILKEGIRCNEEGMIFLFADVIYEHSLFKKFRVADHIAKCQIFLDKYSLFKIDSKGIDSNVYDDNVAEFTAKYQFYIKQDLIKPEHIQFIETRDISNIGQIIKLIKSDLNETN